MGLFSVIDGIEKRKKCSGCPLLREGRRPLVIKPSSEDGVKAVVVTESPWEIEWDIDLVTSIANIPTFPYLYCLLGGEFRPVENANTYWTHTCKCPLKNIPQKNKAIKFCSKAYLRDEIEAVDPKLVIAVGGSALKFFARETGDRRLRGKLTEVFLNQSKGIYDGVQLGSAVFSLAVAPHPSRKSRLWNKPPKGIIQIFKQVIEDIKWRIRENI